MSRAEFEVAHKLIKIKQYKEARIILSAMNDPRARAWLANLDLLIAADRDKHKPLSRDNKPLDILVGLLVAGMGLVLVSLIVLTVGFTYSKLNPPPVAMPSITSMPITNGDKTFDRSSPVVVTATPTLYAGFSAGVISVNSSVLKTPTNTPIPKVTQGPILSSGSGPTALCGDGSYSYAAHHQGACAKHKGVAFWFR